MSEPREGAGTMMGNGSIVPGAGMDWVEGATAVEGLDRVLVEDDGMTLADGFGKLSGFLPIADSEDIGNVFMAASMLSAAREPSAVTSST
jgi:hypothetical protein